MSLTLSYRVTGVEAARRHLASLDGAYAQAQVAVIRPLGQRYLDVLRAETPAGQGEDAGRLRQGYTTEESYGRASGVFRIRNQTPHLRYVIRGRGPIVARGRALRFVIAGQVFFRKRVAAVAPNPFPDRARQIMQADLQRAGADLRAAIVRIYRGGA